MTIRSGAILGLVAAAALLAAGPGFALVYPQNPQTAFSQYSQLRDRLHADLNPVPAHVAAGDLSLRGQVLELRGRLQSAMHWSDAAGQTVYFFLLQTPEGVSVALNFTEPVEGIRLDEPIRVLASLPADSDTRDFTLHGVVRECDLPAPPAPLPTPAAPPAAGDVCPVPTGRPAPTQTPVWDGLPATPGAQCSLSALPEVGMTSAEIGKWKAWVAKYNPKLSDLQRELVVRWVIAYSAIYGLAHHLSFAMIRAESDFDPTCLSHAGAMGMTQLMPCNLDDMDVSNPWNVQENLRGGIRLLSEEMHKFSTRSNYDQCLLGLAAYNAGPGAVKKYGGVPPYKETQNYVKKVSQSFYDLVQAGYP
ncbi:MAG TPA: lytic transglycosylase domain-containing protein [Armatimonadota bacterium]|jgi:hypothetical protein